MILRTKAYNDPGAFLRRNPYQPNRLTRAEMLILYMKKFDIDLSLNQNAISGGSGASGAR